MMFILFFSLNGFASQKSEPEKARLENKVFMDSERFLYFEEDMEATFEVTKSPGLRSFSGVLLGITTNNNESRSLIIDWDEVKEYLNIFLLSEGIVSKFEIKNENIFSGDTPAFFRFYFNFKRDSASLAIGDTVIRLEGINLKINRGYKFSVLPALSISNVPNRAPALEIINLNVWISERSYSFSIWYWFIIIIIVDLLIFLWVHLRRKRLKRLRALREQEEHGTDVQENILSFRQIELPRTKAIYLFGGFQVLDSTGEDITKKFSPLLKELLSLLIIHSSKKGISSDKLSEILWFDKDRTSAKNNRSVNIGKLRTLLDAVGKHEIGSETGYWRFDTDDIFVDYIEFSKTINSSGKPQKETIEYLMALMRNGNLLPGVDYSWLDNFKARISDTVIEKLWNYATTIDIKKENELIVALGERIHALEPINEQALYLKCKAYNASGRHSTAKKVYDRFIKEYKAVYGEEFPVSFTDLLQKTEWND